MKKLFITLIFLFTLLPHGYILADEKTITISGRVQNKTENFDSSKEYIIKLMQPLEKQKFFEKKENLNVVLVSGVNGVGKTTTIGKIGKILKMKYI